MTDTAAASAALPASTPVAVVGAGPGIGAHTARRFAAAGHPVAVMGRDLARLGALAAEIEAAGGRAVAVRIDVADRAGIEPAFAEVRAALGDPGVLVHNPLSAQAGLPTSLDLAQLDRDLATNVGGALACVHAVLPAMRAAGRGVILHTGGGLSLEPWADWSGVAVSKAAQRSIFRSLALELAPAGIHVAILTVCGIVAPGTEYAAELMADKHFQLASQPAGAWDTEIIVR